MIFDLYEINENILYLVWIAYKLIQALYSSFILYCTHFDVVLKSNDKNLSLYIY